MKVWVVVWEVPDESWDIESVHSSFQAAKAACLEQSDKVIVDTDTHFAVKGFCCTYRVAEYQVQG